VGVQDHAQSPTLQQRKNQQVHVVELLTYEFIPPNDEACQHLLPYRVLSAMYKAHFNHVWKAD
jgi:hypothetical protein